ncbi:hypothetical protein CCR96_16590 [Halochromatium roseum]|nr:hypothetical protein [Halochromatium roseum]
MDRFVQAQRPAGFFALSAASVRADRLPPEMVRKLSTLQNRLRYSDAWPSILRSDACRKVVQASQILAVAFYRHFGFEPLPVLATQEKRDQCA